MKFLATPYHINLLADKERLSVFREAIKEEVNGVVYDIGAGSGILSYFAVPHSDFIFALETDPKSAQCATQNLQEYGNVQVINADASNFHFPKKADVIICEMLDTALIDEEQVPVLNNVLKYLKEDGIVIPHAVINGAEPVFMNRSQITYQDVDDLKSVYYEPLGEMVIYNKVDFRKNIKEEVDIDLRFQIDLSLPRALMNGIKITTFTLLNDHIVCGPTPMLNPPLFIPVDEISLDEMKLNGNKSVIINIQYTMGGGLDTIKTRIKDIS